MQSNRKRAFKLRVETSSWMRRMFCIHYEVFQLLSAAALPVFI